MRLRLQRSLPSAQQPWQLQGSCPFSRHSAAGAISNGRAQPQVDGHVRCRRCSRCPGPGRRVGMSAAVVRVDAAAASTGARTSLKMFAMVVSVCSARWRPIQRPRSSRSFFCGRRARRRRAGCRWDRAPCVHPRSYIPTARSVALLRGLGKGASASRGRQSVMLMEDERNLKRTCRPVRLLICTVRGWAA